MTEPEEVLSGYILLEKIPQSPKREYIKSIDFPGHFFRFRYEYDSRLSNDKVFQLAQAMKNSL